LESVDCLVMGRKTFKTVQGFNPWPYGKLPVIVLSSTLETPPIIEGAKIRVRCTSPAHLLRDLAEEGFRKVYIDGGVTIHGFLREDLVDHLTVATIPVVLGAGRPLFPVMEKELKFRLERIVCMDSGIVKTTYIRSRDS
jgi:dihydrofolate reductase